MDFSSLTDCVNKHTYGGYMRKKINKTRIISCLLVFILTFFNCYVPEAYAVDDKNNSAVETNSNQVNTNEIESSSNDIIVKYKDGDQKSTTEKNIQSNSKAKGFNRKRYLKKQEIAIYEIKEADNVEKVIAELNDDPNVEYAQPNYPLDVAAVPTDDKFTYQWSLFNDGQEADGDPGRATVDINVLNAWNLTMGNKDVVIGVLDTGIDINHPDLSENIYTNTKETPNNCIDDDGNGYIDDINGWDFANDDASVYDAVNTDTHGTYVAGIIAASVNDGGITGVAPMVKVMPLKFIHGTTGYTSDAIEAIEYAKKIGVKVINCSFGGTDNNLALQDIMKNSGILFICSAGNNGSDTAKKPVYPAAFPIDNVISVAAIDSQGVLPEFSSYGKNVDVAAPGTNIYGTTPGEDNNYSDNYNYYSGTSVSAAIVSGIAGLILSDNPDISIPKIKEQIIKGVVKCATLKDKIASGGRVDAFAALTGTIQSDDDYKGEGSNGDMLPVEGDGKSDTWYTTDELARNVERFHYGEGGVNPSSGNYSTSCTDMSIPAPGFAVNISRTYNSKDQRQTLLGRGWTFGFEGKITNKEDILEVSLPNGSAHVFHIDNDKYVAEGTRAKLEKTATGSYILTTQDQYKYGFDSKTYELTYMEDKSGNRINLTYESGRLTKITDTVGRVYTLAYNAKSLLSCVTDPANRTVTYEYNENNLLSKVIDPQGGILTYQYDASEYLTTLIDQNKHTIQKLTYSHDPGDSQNKVIVTSDAAGETWNYSYCMNNRNTTITNNKNKKWTYWFDAAMYTIKNQDPDGKSTITEYTYQDSNTYYGDVKANIDRNGNRTDYDVDLKTGNITKIINPDGGIRSKIYDQWNNVIEEVNECGNRTFYIYDSEGINLIKKVQPLNGTSNYNAGNTTDFAVTTYEYYTKSEANKLFGCNAAGLQKSVTDPEGNTTTYTYNRYGDTLTIKDPVGNVTTYTYDIIGEKLTETTPESNRTEWKYDKNGKVIKEIHPDGGVKRTVYDAAGYTILEVDPNEYDTTKENKTNGTYTGTEGTQYEWFDNGYQKSITDALGNRIEYTWDIFGNRQTEKKPNRSIYRYEYDALNRMTKTYFKENESASEVLLNEVTYGILSNHNTQITNTTYTDKSQKSTTVTIKDYANREIEVQLGDYSRTSVKYNLDGTIKQKTAANGAITYYKYDSLQNMTDEWKPMMVADNNTLYSWTGYVYNKAGNQITDKYGKSLVTLNATTEDILVKQYTYKNGLMMNESDSEGRKTNYTYDGEGRQIQINQSISPTENQITEKKYNYLGKEVSITQKVRAGDIAGNTYSDDNSIDLISTFSYDLNGNPTSSSDVAGNITLATYDKLNRVLSTTRQLKNAKGELISNVTNSQTYTWDGKIANQTDAKGNKTSYSYDAMGNQTKSVDTLGNTTLKLYDYQGRNTVVVAPKNYQSDAPLGDMERTEFVYDSMGRVLKQIEVYQKINLSSTYKREKEWATIIAKTYQYDTLGNTISVTDALGNTTRTDYNLAGLVEYVTDAETNAMGIPFTIKYSYNGLGQKVKETYPKSEYVYTYDGVGDLLRTQVDGILKSSAIYDFLGRTIKSTDGLGNTTTQSWNALGKISKSNTPGDKTIAAYQMLYQYDVLGNLIYTKDTMDKVATYTYDSFGRNLSKIDSDISGNQKIKTSTSYDLNGNVLSQTDGNGNTTTSTYDTLNRVVTTTNALKQTTTYTYDVNGNLLKHQNYLGNTTTNVYDGINRLVEVRDSTNNIVQQILYNDANAQISSYDALHNRTQFLYDKNLRQAGTIDGEGNISRITYDVRGNVSSKTDGKGNATTYQYDSDNKLINVTDALGNNTYYTYDIIDNILSETDGNGNSTTYQYNAANLKIAKIDPSGRGNSSKMERYTYYPNGLMATKTDRNQVITTYKYDIFGRLLTEDSGGEVQSYTYDANGNMLTMTDTTGITVRTYDALNRNLTKTVPDIGKTTYVYDLLAIEAGEYMDRTTDPKGNVTEKIYDKMGRLSQVSIGNQTITYDYYRNGRRSSVIYPEGTKETYTYDKNNQVTSLINSKEEGTVISSFQYSYDAAGNQLTKKEEKGTTTYTYDTLNRLSTVTETDSKTTSYTYDGAGNRKSEQVTKGSLYTATIYKYNNQNHLTSTVSSSGEETKYVYDNNGNLLNKSTNTVKALGAEELTAEDLPSFDLIIKRQNENGTGTKDLTYYNYDHFNRLVKTKSDTSTASYRYNAQGFRVEKKVNGDVTRYLYEADKVVLETDENNNQKAFQAYGSNLLYRTTTADKEMGAQSYYYLYNAHGDVTSLINPSGTVAVTYDYDAFGNILSKTGEANNSILYAGYQHDDESGLYYLNARYYDSVTARFISEDSYRGQKNDPLSLNLYTYCQGNPIKYTDPSGHKKANITVGGIEVGNGKVNKRTYTGNLTDVVTGLGGEITRDKKGNVYANIVDAETGKIEITKYNTKTMKDSNGNSFKIVNGQIQVDVVGMSENAGVGDTVSWWNDNKKSNIVVQPDMKYAPVQVTRAGNDVTIKAFVNFTGDSNELMPSTKISYITAPGSKTPPSGMTFGEVAAQSIMDTWNGTYDVYGQTVNISTEIYSNCYSPNNILQPVWASKEQKYLNYEILEGTDHTGEKIGMGSHNDPSSSGLINGLFNTLIPGDYNGENIYNWSIGNSSQHIVVYTHTNNEYIGDNWFKQTAAHEFGHALGLGDAYNAGYRGGSWLGSVDGYYAPYKYSVNDSYGSNYDVYVPNNDIMLEGASQNYVYSNDIRMVLDAYRTGEVQLYPWGSKDYNKR